VKHEPYSRDERFETMKKYLLLGLLLPTVAACQVDNDIADDGESGSAEARVAAKAADFCQSTCDRLSRCEIEKLVDEDNCVGECQELFEEEFLHRGEACAEAGERLMGCFSRSTCEDFANDKRICEISEAEDEACDAGGSSEPPMGGGTTSPGDPPPVDADGPLYCSGTSASGGTAPGAESFACDKTWHDCDDGRSYAVSCVESEQGPPVCTCSVDGADTTSFSLVELTCPTDPDINVGCDFWLAPLDHAPPSRVSCQGGAGGGGPVDGTGCSVDFYDCEGSSYHLECTGSGGTERCVCYVDGQPTGSFHDPAGFCPSTGTDDELRRLNAGCGWYLSY
jgi:hypothetical protein